MIAGKYTIVHRDKSGNLKNEFEATNFITNRGVKIFLERLWIQTVSPESVSDVDYLVMGLIDNDGFTAVALSDRGQSHPGWSEYAGIAAGRPDWIPEPQAESYRGLSTQLHDSNGIFTITANGSIRGVFLICVDSMGVGDAVDEGDDIISIALFPSAVAVADDDVIQVVYHLHFPPTTEVLPLIVEG